MIRGDARQPPALLPAGTARAGRPRRHLSRPTRPFTARSCSSAHAERRGPKKLQPLTAMTFSTSPTTASTTCSPASPSILAGCTALLRPGGTVVVTARPWRQHGELVDLPGAILAAGPRAD